MEEPLVTVVVPAYNTARWIGRAVRSVLAQSYGHFELIIVDDASTEDIPAALLEFNDPRLRYHRHPVNRGASAARNTGVGLAKGRFVAFLDSDDEWLPGKLEKQVHLFQRSGDAVGVVYTGWRWIDDDGVKIIQEKTPTRRGNLLDLLLGDDGISSFSTPLLKRRILEEVGAIDESMPARQDWEYWLRMASLCEFEVVPEVLANYHIRKGSISSDIPGKIRGTEAVLEKYREDFARRPGALARHYILLSIFNLILGEDVAARIYIKRSIEVHARDMSVRWKGAIHYVLSFMPLSVRIRYFKLMRMKNKDFFWILR